MNMNFDQWIMFPQQLSLCQVVLNRMLMPLKWSLWTNKALLASTDGADIRSRLSNQYAVLGSTAGVLVTISAAAFLITNLPGNGYFLQQVFGVCTFLASMLLFSYIVVALTILFPLIESSRDELLPNILLELFKNMRNLDGYLLTLAINSFAVGLLVIVPVLYSMEVLYIAIFITVGIYM